MHINEKGLQLIKSFEGCSLNAYRCPAGVWTIGYGHTEGVCEGMRISKKEADEFLKKDMEKYEKYVCKYCHSLQLNVNEFSALVSFCYNCGQSNLKRLVSERTKVQIADAILLYNKAGGSILAGLVRRRKAERELFLEKTNKVYAVKRGDRGQSVKDIQHMLTKHGLLLDQDGIFGKNTEKAVKSFQKMHELKVDGIVGPATLEKLTVPPIESSVASFSLRKNGNVKVSKNFKVKEFRCKDGSDLILIDKSLVEKLQMVREHFGLPIIINSGYRTATHNAHVGGTKNSYHIKGKAFDISIVGVQPVNVAKYCQSIGISGIIVYETFTHIDSRSSRYWAIKRNNRYEKVNSF